MTKSFSAVHESGFCTFETSNNVRYSVAVGCKAHISAWDVAGVPCQVCNTGELTYLLPEFKAMLTMRPRH